MHIASVTVSCRNVDGVLVLENFFGSLSVLSSQECARRACVLLDYRGRLCYFAFDLPTNFVSEDWMLPIEFEATGGFTCYRDAKF
jgi:hypothetical protein